MKRPVVWVTVTLTVAIVVTTTLLIATTSRGDSTSFGSSAGQLEVQTGRPALDRQSRWLPHRAGI